MNIVASSVKKSAYFSCSSGIYDLVERLEAGLYPSRNGDVGGVLRSVRVWHCGYLNQYLGNLAVSAVILKRLKSCVFLGVTC
jgi:hypothetical protein